VDCSATTLDCRLAWSPPPAQCERFLHSCQLFGEPKIQDANWYDPSTLASGPSTPSGTAVRTRCGPGLVNVDRSVTKKFASGKMELAFLVEMFNVGNQVHRARPGYTVQTSTTSNNNRGNSLFMNVRRRLRTLDGMA
jgi:hypothetical protein